jgi:hypothetical protein
MTATTGVRFPLSTASEEWDTNDEQFVPFSNGSQWLDWQESNCERCTKSEERDENDCRACPIITAIEWSAWGQPLTPEMAYRMGYVDQEGNRSMAYVWPCREVEWTEEWKTEHRRRYGEPEERS